MDEQLSFCFEQENQKRISSVDVAKMLGRRHDHVLRTIRDNIEKMKKLSIENIDAFFTETTYKSSSGVRPCFSVTKEGCYYLSSKMYGDSGVEFTAQFAKAFSENEQAMEEQAKVEPVEIVELEVVEVEDKQEEKAVACVEEPIEFTTSMQLQFMNEQVKLMSEMVKTMAELEYKMFLSEQNKTAVKQYAEELSNTVKYVPEEWRDFAKRSIAKIAEVSVLEIKTIWSEVYRELEAKEKVRLGTRLVHMKKECQDNKVPKKQIDRLNRLDVIEADKHLIESFVQIIKQKADNIGIKIG